MNWLRFKLGLSSKKPIVLFIPHTLTNFGYFGEAEMKQTLLYVMETMKDFKNIQFVIKLHNFASKPDFDFFKEQKKLHKLGKVVVIQKADPNLLINLSDFLIVHHSTMALDGFYFFKDVITLTEPNRPSEYEEFEEYKVFYEATNKEELSNHIKTLLEHPEKKGDWRRCRADCFNDPIWLKGEKYEKRIKELLKLDG